MRRRKDTRPAVVYWLVDTRTGVPFYCGKTVLLPERRLLAHRYDAVKGTTRVNVKVRECGENIRIDTMEVVPLGDDWGAREKYWIFTLRIINPDCCNTVDGGAGVPGRIPSDETREKLSAWQRGRKLTTEHREKIRQNMLGKTWPTERIERMRAKLKGRIVSAEQRAKIAEANRGRPSKYKGVPRSDEVKAKISAANIGRTNSPEHRAKISASLKVYGATNPGRKMSAESIAKSAANRTGQKRTPEQRARMRTARLAYLAATRNQVAQ